jgi:hypothetical protein
MKVPFALTNHIQKVNLPVVYLKSMPDGILPSHFCNVLHARSIYITNWMIKYTSALIYMYNNLSPLDTPSELELLFFVAYDTSYLDSYCSNYIHLDVPLCNLVDKYQWMNIINKSDLLCEQLNTASKRKCKWSHFYCMHPVMYLLVNGKLLCWLTSIYH